MIVKIKSVLTSESATTKKAAPNEDQRIGDLKTQIAGIQKQLEVLQNELNLALKRKSKAIDDSKNAVLAAKAKELKSAGVTFLVVGEGKSRTSVAIKTALDRFSDDAKLYAVRGEKKSLIARCRTRMRLDGPPVKGTGGSTSMGHYIWEWTTETARKKYLGV